jgi:hypothetical protein
MGKGAIKGKEQGNGTIMRAGGAEVEDITIGYIYNYFIFIFYVEPLLVGSCCFTHSRAGFLTAWTLPSPQAKLTQKW